ncbi:MAG: hypothetical protein LAO03_18035 [Acidobacteriia bacterium]|nr:hypothetical protein [Terriglobia bacterium]
MFSWDDPKDRAKIVRLTADLRSVQVELLSALVAAGRLRLHYSTEEIARFGEQQVLQKAIDAARELEDYFSAIAQRMSSLPDGREAARE